MSIKQVKFGSSEISFKKLSDTGLNCAPCQTPTPTPTVQCISINLKSTIGCEEYSVVDAEVSTSVDKMTDAIVFNDSLLCTGFSSCNYITDSLPISRCVMSKLLLENTETERVFSADPEFGTAGKVNNLFYNSENLRVFAKYNKFVLQPGSTQKKILAVGQTNYQPLIARYLENGYSDRSFGNGLGYVVMDSSIENIKLLNIFGTYIQSDNKILIFCDGYDLTEKRSMGVILRLGNNGAIDSSFSMIKIRPEKAEFDGNRLIGKNVFVSNNSIYITFESFSSISNNNVITCLYDIVQSGLSAEFGDSGFIYNNNESKNTYFSNILQKSILVGQENLDMLMIITNVNSESLIIEKYNAATGKIVEPKDGDTDDNIAKYSRLVIDNQIFKLRESPTQAPENLIVSFSKMPSSILMSGEDVLLAINVNILSNPIDILGGKANSLIHWLESQSLVSGEFSFDGLSYRDCATESCDRLPEDNYGSLVINKSNIKKYLTQSRVLFGYINISDSTSKAESIKLDRFDENVTHNILTKIVKVNNDIIACGYSGHNSESNFSIKTADIATNNIDSLGPFNNDIIGSVSFNDFCKTIESMDESVVVEECPCAPTPTPSSNSIVPDTDLITSTSIASICVDSIPTLSISWEKSSNNADGNYLAQIFSGDTEVIAQNFTIESADNSGTININLSTLVDNTDINNKTARLDLINSSTSKIEHTKLFVLNIPNNCEESTTQ